MSNWEELIYLTNRFIIAIPGTILYIVAAKKILGFSKGALYLLGILVFFRVEVMDVIVEKHFYKMQTLKMFDVFWITGANIVAISFIFLYFMKNIKTIKQFNLNCALYILCELTTIISVESSRQGIKIIPVGDLNANDGIFTLCYKIFVEIIIACCVILVGYRVVKYIYNLLLNEVIKISNQIYIIVFVLYYTMYGILTILVYVKSLSFIDVFWLECTMVMALFIFTYFAVKIAEIEERELMQAVSDKNNLEMQHHMMLDYYTMLNRQIEETKKYRHDINKYISIIKDLEHNNTGSEINKKLIKDVTDNYEQIRRTEYCNHPVVNAVILNKVLNCEELNISINIQMENSDWCNIKELDLISLLMNLLDNAIEEIKQMSILERNNCNREYDIELNCAKKYNQLVLVVGNKTNKKDIRENLLEGNSFKTKKKASYHGQGLLIIKDIVNRYNGMADVEIKDGWYEILLSLY